MIDLTNILSHLPKDKIKELETIRQRIVDSGKAEIVVLFGSYARGNYKEKRGETQGKKSDYDILVAVSEYETKKEQELFDYLNFAYIGGRYRSEEEFPVTKEQLDYWSKEIRKLLDLTEIVCCDRIACLKEIEKTDNTM